MYSRLTWHEGNRLCWRHKSGIGLRISLGSVRLKGASWSVLCRLWDMENQRARKSQSGCAACSLLNSTSHPPLIQPDTANFGIRVWNENQYLFGAWKQRDRTLGRAWPGAYVQGSVSAITENFQDRALKTHVQVKSDCQGGVTYVACSHPGKAHDTFPSFLYVCFFKSPAPENMLHMRSGASPGLSCSGQRSPTDVGEASEAPGPRTDFSRDVRPRS